MQNLIPVLANATDRKLEFGNELRDEVLLIAVKKVSPQELLDRVAEAAAAAWIKKENGVVVLTRPKGIEDKQRKEWVEERVARLRTAYATFKKNALPEAPYTEQEAALLLNQMKETGMTGPITDAAQFERRTALEGKMPIGRLFARMLELIDLRKVAEAGMADKVVFSTQPTKAQARFKSPIIPILKQFQEEHAAFAKAAESMSVLPLAGGHGAGADFLISPIADAPVNARLSVHSRGTGLRLSLFDANGKSIGMFIASPRIVRDLAAEMDKSMTPYAAVPIQLPADCLEFNSAFRGHQRGTSKWQPAGDELRKLFLTPEQADPLKFSASATLLQIIDAAKANFVGCVPDIYVTGANSIAPYAAVRKLRIKGGWLEGSPSDYETRLARVPRKVLGDYVREISKNNVPTLTANVTLAGAGISNQNDPRWRMVSGYQTALGSPLDSLASSEIAAGIYRALTEAQRGELESGKAVRFGDLPGAVRQTIGALLHRSSSENLIEDQAPGGPAQMPGSTLRGEATQSWPDGIPDDAEILLQAQRDNVLVNVDSLLRGSLAYSDLAYDLALRSMQKPMNNDYQDNHRLLQTERVKWTFRVRHQDLTLIAILGGLEVRPGVKAVKFADLPPEPRQEVEELKQRIIKSLGGG